MGNVRWFDKRVKEPEPPFFRFAVRCDRETNRAIEKIAKRAGMTANAFVQAYFDRILEEPGETGGRSTAETAQDGRGRARRVREVVEEGTAGSRRRSRP